MPGVTCKDCGKHWVSRGAFDDDPGCDKGWCRQPGGLSYGRDGVEVDLTEELLMGRGRGNRNKNKPPHIEVPSKPVEVTELTRGRVRVACHRTSTPVWSEYDKKEPHLELTVDDCININIFPRGRIK